jgi:uncharacterized membrane protein
VKPSPAVTLSLPDPEFAAAVAADVALGLAVHAGFTALAADRVRRDLHAAVEAAATPLRIVACAAPGRVDVTIEASLAEGARRAAEVLEPHGPQLDSTSLAVAFVAAHRGSLRLV